MSRRWRAALLAALLLLALGVFLGEPTQVLLNAVGVCLACMGIG